MDLSTQFLQQMLNYVHLDRERGREKGSLRVHWMVEGSDKGETAEGFKSEESWRVKNVQSL